MSFSKLDAAKAVVRVLLSSGVAKVVNDVIAENVTVETVPQKVQVWIGALALSAVAVNGCWNFTEEQIDKSVETIAKIKEEMNAEEVTAEAE